MKKPGQAKPQEAQVDRVILAQIRGCKDTTMLQGAACTNRCEHRRDCNLRRTPFLILTQGFDLAHEKQPYEHKGKTRHHRIPRISKAKDKGIPTVDLQVTGTLAPDDYVNDIFGAFEGR